MTKVKNPYVIYDNNQGMIFLENNMQVGISKEHINIRHNFLPYMAEDKDIDIQYIRRKNNPAEIMTKNTSEADFAKHMKTITQGEIWEILDTGRQNIKKTGVMDDVITRDNKTGVTDDVITRDKIEYFSHILAEVV